MAWPKIFAKSPPQRPTPTPTPLRPSKPAPAAPPGMTPVRPTSDAPRMYNGFDCLPPDTAFAGQSTPTGPLAGARAGIPYIQAETSLPVADLPAKFIALIEHC